MSMAISNDWGEFCNVGPAIRMVRLEDLISEPVPVFTNILQWIDLLAPSRKARTIL
jgi:hypothetical protein